MVIANLASCIDEKLLPEFLEANVLTILLEELNTKDIEIERFVISGMKNLIKQAEK